MIDTTTLKERVDLFDLVSRDAQLRKVAASEFAGPCPKCGGDDRLHLDSAAGWWFCRQCHEKRGDAIEYLQWRDGLTFGDACAALADGRAMPATDTPRRAQIPAQPEPEPPAAIWQDRAAALVRYAEGQLWQNEHALAYLRDRGLTDATIREARLGYVPREMFDAGARWGRDSKTWIPQGWAIPCYAGGALQYVKVRQEHPAADGWKAAKYVAIGGSHKRGAAYGLDLLPEAYADLVLCEGELNALILRQVLAPVCAVLSVGDAGNLPGGPALGAIARARRLWALFDPDGPGQEGERDLLAAFARARALTWPWADRGAKYDLNDAHRDGENLAAWAIREVGPTEREARQLWARYWMEYGPLDRAAEVTTDDSDLALRLWRALLGEYERSIKE